MTLAEEVNYIISKLQKENIKLKENEKQKLRDRIDILTDEIHYRKNEIQYINKMLNK